jgi:hypothetical protein
MLVKRLVLGDGGVLGEGDVPYRHMAMGASQLIHAP